MRKLVLASVAIGTAVAALPAAAQTNAPFTGARIEALGGYDNLQDGGDGSSEGRDGFVYGVGLGYDVQAGGVVLGAEGEITDSTTRARSYNAITAGDRFSINAGRDLYLGGRVGYVISPRAMIYAKGGYTNARVESRYDAGTTTFRDHTNLDGFRVGAGLEYNITPTAYVKGEYRYSHYGDVDGYDIDADRHQLMGGVGIRF
ncbi:outer membrane immunogenic protein [Sphingomonas palmae]|uniref:Outer membrane immunogenic protein n=1 Tax=Sphingomonas palmae TaxID=1855283 RepID=A0A1H7RTI7_9SPHN|nr:outer membrane beta-barrel protein [Sphingomonas palmae]SEL63339.1 outer membrane immunogenic protein [Sphingomonas palmae]